MYSNLLGVDEALEYFEIVLVVWFSRVCSIYLTSYLGPNEVNTICHPLCPEIFQPLCCSTGNVLMLGSILKTYVELLQLKQTDMESGSERFGAFLSQMLQLYRPWTAYLTLIRSPDFIALDDSLLYVTNLASSCNFSAASSFYMTVERSICEMKFKIVDRGPCITNYSVS